MEDIGSAARWRVVAKVCGRSVDGDLGGDEADGLEKGFEAAVEVVENGFILPPGVANGFVLEAPFPDPNIVVPRSERGVGAEGLLPLFSFICGAAIIVPRITRIDPSFLLQVFLLHVNTCSLRS